MIVFETTLCVLAVFKAVQITRTGSRVPRLLTTMLRDTVAYFGGILVVIVVNFVIWVVARVGTTVRVSTIQVLTGNCDTVVAHCCHDRVSTSTPVGMWLH